MRRPFSVTEADKLEAERVSKVRRYVGDPSRNLPGDLYALCVEVLGYTHLSARFHGPLLSEMDRQDLKRFRQWEGLQTYSEPLDDLIGWAREHIKTWVQRARVIRYYLWNHEITVTWYHAIETKALESGNAIADQILLNKKLRWLFKPGILPAPNSKKFFSGGTFSLKGRGPGASPSLFCAGAGAESTGGHSDVGVADDFVGYNDVVDSQMPKKLQWFQGTFCNVVMKENEATKRTGWKDIVHTPWAIDDPYVWMEESGLFRVSVLGCLSPEPIEGKQPMTVGDYTGYPRFLTPKEIIKQYELQGPLFPYQMMCDRTARGDKPWVAEGCEHYCTLKEAAGAGWVVALGDPAPRAVGSVGGRDERYRKDGTKNWWANVVVKLRRKGDLRQIVWLDAEQSKDWGLSEGMDNLVKLGMKWHAKEGYAESTSTPVYMDEFIRSKRELGWRAHLIGEGRKFNAEDRLKQTYNAMAKCAYLTALADRAKAVEFVICESVPKEMVEVFLRQMRGFMPLPDGRTGIPFDDMANAISFATDPYFAPKYQAVSQEFAWSPFREAERDDEYVEGSRHVRW